MQNSKSRGEREGAKGVQIAGTEKGGVLHPGKIVRVQKAEALLTDFFIIPRKFCRKSPLLHSGITMWSLPVFRQFLSRFAVA